MQFNTGQMQELTGIRREQLRHWRKVLPPLVGRDGRADLYTFPEVLALAVIALLVYQLGISVSHLSACSTDIFALFVEQDDLSGLPRLLHVTKAGTLVVDIEPDDEAFVSIHTPKVLARVLGGLAPYQRRQLSLPWAG